MRRKGRDDRVGGLVFELDILVHIYIYLVVLRRLLFESML